MQKILLLSKSITTKRMSILLGVIMALFAGFPGQPLKAADLSKFNPGNIIDDTTFTRADSMSEAAIQSFLENKNSVCLRNYYDAEPLGNNQYGGQVRASRIIWKVSQLYSINPQVLLATLQKETSLVTRSSCPGDMYKIALGYGCPDTAAGCDSQWFGFSRQLYQGARHFRGFFDPAPGWYVPYTPGSRYVQYNPIASCGGTVVNILNRATASLYSYTPYQPNSAALAAGYGTGDSCSAYGNRNFFHYFTDWFGSTQSGDPVVVKAENGSAQYVLLNNRLFPIPSVDIKLAYGLERFGMIEMSPSFIANLPTEQALSRLIRPSGGLGVYLVDSRTKYGFSSLQMLQAWGRSTSEIRDVPATFANILGNGATLGASMRAPSGSGNGVYLVDGGTLHLIDSADTLRAWQGDLSVAMTPSQAYFSSYSVGQDVTGFKIQANNQKYVVNAGTRLTLSDVSDAAYPGSALTVSPLTIERLPSVGVATLKVRANDAAAVYQIESGSKRAFPSPDMLSAWSSNNQPDTTVLTSGHIAKFTNGSDITNYLARGADDSYYLMDGAKRRIPSQLVTNYVGGKPASTVQDSTLNSIINGTELTRYVKRADEAGINLMDYGTIKTFPTPSDFALWGGTNTNVSVVSRRSLSQYQFTGAATASVTNGSQNYLFANPGTFYSFNVNAGRNWKLQPTSTVHPATMQGLTDGGTIPTIFKAGSKTYLLRDGIGYAGDDANLLNVWGLENTTSTLDASLIGRFFQEKPLTKYVVSSDKNDGKVYVVSGGKLLYLANPAQMKNQGFKGENVVDVNASDIDARGTVDWNAAIVKGSNGAYYVIDEGTKRIINDDAVAQWTNSQTLPLQTVPLSFLHLLANSSNITKAIRLSNDWQIFAVVAGQKRQITKYTTLVQGYAPETVVSTSLSESLPLAAPVD